MLGEQISHKLKERSGNSGTSKAWENINAASCTSDIYFPYSEGFPMNVLSYTAPNRGIRLLGYAGQRSPPHKAKTTIAWFERGTDSLFLRGPPHRRT